MPRVILGLREGGFTKSNFRGREVAFPGGIALIAVITVTLVPLGLLDQLADLDYLGNFLPPILFYLFGVGALGLIDDYLDNEEDRGFRGHGLAALRGSLSSGLLKAVGALGLALYVLSGRYLDDSAKYLLAVAILVLSTNLFNMLDLRPGRSIKFFILLLVLLSLGTWSFTMISVSYLILAPVLLLFVYDLREKAMLGDTGSNMIGGLAGFSLITLLGTTGQIVALIFLIIITIYGEFRSLNKDIERLPLLRQLDFLGRTNA